MIAYWADRLRRQETVEHRKRADRDRSRSQIIDAHMRTLIDALNIRFALARLFQNLSNEANETDANMTTSDSNDGDAEREYAQLAVSSVPKLSQLNQLRRMAALGDQDAIDELDRLTRLAPRLVRSLFQVVVGAKQMVLEQLTGDDHLLSQAVVQELESRVDELVSRSGDHPIDRMIAEVTAIACWMPHVAAFWPHAPMSDTVMPITFNRSPIAQRGGSSCCREFNRWLNGLALPLSWGPVARVGQIAASSLRKCMNLSRQRGISRTKC